MAVLGSSIVNGNLAVTGEVRANTFMTVSDRDLKENIKDCELDYTDIVDKLDLKEFNYISDANKTKLIGIIAQDLLAILPEDYKESFINQLDSEHLVVNTTSLLFLALGAIQQQQKEIDRLKQEIEELKK